MTYKCLKVTVQMTHPKFGRKWRQSVQDCWPPDYLHYTSTPNRLLRTACTLAASLCDSICGIRVGLHVCLERTHPNRPLLRIWKVSFGSTTIMKTIVAHLSLETPPPTSNKWLHPCSIASLNPGASLDLRETCPEHKLHRWFSLQQYTCRDCWSVSGSNDQGNNLSFQLNIFGRV